MTRQEAMIDSSETIELQAAEHSALGTEQERQRQINRLLSTSLRHANRRVLLIKGVGHVASQDDVLSRVGRHKLGLLSHSVGTWG
ncbi:hypothetical protein EYF80_013093 [Liparis tanakae]|uniref:Uncharacterized protein n=1 Tax=Liparis tanakae TaxID=230148 RepID=A0A4Z2IFT8_9TELE|nr:hypothetical protein EYF80_013093 [Liparis tanakae]